MNSIAGVKFRNYSHLQALTKDILYKKIGFGTLVTAKNDYYSFLCELFARHPEKESKLEGEIVGFRTYRNVLNPRSMGVSVLSEIESSFSWKTCTNQEPKFNVRQAFYNACRESITDQIMDYKKSNKMVCCECGSTDRIEIDHWGPFEFREIVNQFLELYKMPRNYGKNKTTRQCIFLHEDRKIKKDFQDIHRKFAQLRPVCKMCHATKSYSPKQEKTSGEVVVCYN